MTDEFFEDENVDDGYVQGFTFDSFKNFENWFKKYVI